MIQIEKLTDGRAGCAEKWLVVHDDKQARRLRSFVGSKADCEAVKAEWLAGDCKRGTESKY